MIKLTIYTALIMTIGAIAWGHIQQCPGVATFAECEPDMGRVLMWALGAYLAVIGLTVYALVKSILKGKIT